MDPDPLYIQKASIPYKRKKHDIHKVGTFHLHYLCLWEINFPKLFVFLRARTSRGYKEMSSIIADKKRPRNTGTNWSKCGGREGVAGSQPMSTAVHITWHRDQINFGDQPPYLTYDVPGRWCGAICPESWSCPCLRGPARTPREHAARPSYACVRSPPFSAQHGEIH